MAKRKSIGAGLFAAVAVGFAFTQTAQCMDGQFVSPQLQTGDDFVVDYVRVYDIVE